MSYKEISQGIPYNKHHRLAIVSQAQAVRAGRDHKVPST